ncbi:hypothetical protein KHS38_00065 [Mucilaginibacter sp. Bleaf8]|uniref:hypothetical protein n=1 Tax=Mucilaginibacter sp. Bleaf8 TaxID=2834430 RepID=UPI001BD0C312|nr:hypothetical protein [Mucilaginibacter sp. Bleaf8]MBS7562785.1 hypothetical protein [Mucilaginibacter sp. Bleaf8]
MKKSIIDKGSGIALEFGRLLGATIRGRFIDILESMGQHTSPVFLGEMICV